MSIFSFCKEQVLPPVQESRVVLLLSYPRSGSSWIATVLSHSPDFVYLCEPINQPFIREFKNKTVMDPADDETAWNRYISLADQAFAGISSSESLADTVSESHGLLPLIKPLTRLLIKEVNPLAAEVFVDRYDPQIILLLRHPAAVADSYHRMGWLDVPWEEFGYLYGTHMAKALAACQRGRFLVLQYEQVATDPKVEFSRLFTSLGARAPVDWDKVINSYCFESAPNSDPYGVRRLSQKEAEKWRHHLTEAEIAAVLRGYRKSVLGYYRGPGTHSVRD